VDVEEKWCRCRGLTQFVMFPLDSMMGKEAWPQWSLLGWIGIRLVYIKFLSDNKSRSGNVLYPCHILVLGPNHSNLFLGFVLAGFFFSKKKLKLGRETRFCAGFLSHECHTVLGFKLFWTPNIQDFKVIMLIVFNWELMTWRTPNINKNLTSCDTHVWS
jgi:hypothetical protein